MMLIFNFQAIGDKLLAIRKKARLTQSQVAEAADISDRAYADIERGASISALRLFSEYARH